MSEWNKNCEYGRTDCKPCTHCDAYIPTWTNADRIRAMSDEELAAELKYIVWHADIFGTSFITGGKTWLDWLQQPCEGGADRVE